MFPDKISLMALISLVSISENFFSGTNNFTPLLTGSDLIAPVNILPHSDSKLSTTFSMSFSKQCDLKDLFPSDWTKIKC